MAVQFAKQCAFPQDLDAAFRNLQEDLGDRLNENEVLLDAAIADIGDLELDNKLDEIFNELENLLKQGDGTSDIQSLDELASSLGLPKDPGRSDASAEEKKARANEEQCRDEQFLFDAGMVVHDGVLHVSGSAEGASDAEADNIDRLRDLYNSFDKDLNKVADFLNGIDSSVENIDPILQQSKLVLERVPAKVPKLAAFSVAELSEKLNLPGLEADDVVTLDDFSTVVLKKEFLGSNFSKKKIEQLFGVGEEDLISEVFHINQKKATPRRINKYAQFGYSTEEITLIFRIGATGFPTEDLASLLVLEQNKVSTIIQQIDFFKERLINSRKRGVEVPSIAKAANQQRLNLALLDVQKDHRRLISSLLFHISVLKDLNVLEELRQLHSDEAIVKLLEKRPEIEGIKFSAPVFEKLASLRNGLVDSQPGSRLVSAKAMLRQIPRSTVDQQELLFMWSDLIQAQDDILENPLTPELLTHLDNARNHLTRFLGRDPIREEEDTEDPVQPFDAQEVIAAPSGVLMSVLDFSRTFNVDGVITNIRDIANDIVDGNDPPDVVGDGDDGLSEAGIDPNIPEIDLSALAGRAIAAVVDAIADLFQQAITGCSRLLQKANDQLNTFKKRLDAMLSQLFSLTGSGSFDTSMLKCAINFDIGLSGASVLPLISNLLCVLSSVLGSFLGKFSDWIADLVNKVLCIPLGLVNSLLGVVDSLVPPGCAVPPIELGKTITLSLLNLKNIGDSKNVVVAFMGKDLLKLRMFVNAAGGKVDQFSGGADCAGAVSQAYNSAILNIQGGASLA